MGIEERRPKGLIERELGDLLDEKLDEKLKPVVDRLERRERERFALLGLCALCLLIAATSLYFAVSRGLALDDQIDTNREVLCSQALSTAVAPRGKPIAGESRDNYIARLFAQRSTLLRVTQLNCSDLSGFSAFPYLRGRALQEIEKILERLAPKRLRQAQKTETAAAPDNLAPASLEATSLVVPATGSVPSNPSGGGGGAGPRDDSPSPQSPGPDPPKGGDGGRGDPSSPVPEGSPPPSKEAPEEPEPEGKTPSRSAEEVVVDAVCETQDELGVQVTPAVCDR